MIMGETVLIELRTTGAIDPYGNEVVTYSNPIRVENVLVGRGTQRDDSEQGRPDAMQTDITFCMPREWSQDLRGALITRGAKRYEVVGDPTDYTDANLPPAIPWNVRVGAVYRDG